MSFKLTETQRQAVKEFALAKKRAEQAQAQLFKATNLVQRKNELLQRALGGMNGNKVLVRLRGQAPVIVYRAGGAGAVQCETIETAISA